MGFRVLSTSILVVVVLVGKWIGGARSAKKDDLADVNLSMALGALIYAASAGAVTGHVSQTWLSPWQCWIYCHILCMRRARFARAVQGSYDANMRQAAS